MPAPHLVEVAQWLGQDAAPLDPAAMQYRARPAAEGAAPCSGCVFKGQRAKVCKAAASAAQRAGINDCDDIDVATNRSFVYVLVQIDPRQLSITEKV